MISKETTTEELNDEQSKSDSSEWLKERKRELDRVFDRKAKELSRQAQSKIAYRMNHYSSALRSASKDLEENDEEQLSSITDVAAQRIQKSADYIEQTSPQQIVDDGAEVVRKSPYLTLGICLALGWTFGRLAKAAQNESPTSPNE